MFLGNCARHWMGTVTLSHIIFPILLLPFLTLALLLKSKVLRVGFFSTKLKKKKKGNTFYVSLQEVECVVKTHGRKVHQVLLKLKTLIWPL